MPDYQPLSQRLVRIVPQPWRRPLLYMLAGIYAVVAIVFSWAWMSEGRAKVDVPSVELGFNERFLPSERCSLVESVKSDSPAEQAGLQAGDRILRLDGRPLVDAYSITQTWKLHAAGDSIRLTVLREGDDSPRVLIGVFRQRVAAGGVAEYYAWEARNAYPIPFLLVGLIVLFLRVEDPFVWLLALLLGSFLGIPGFSYGFKTLSPSVTVFARPMQTLFIGMLGPLFYVFFAVFPQRSPLERKAPWLKWVFIAIGCLITFPYLPLGELRIPFIPDGTLGLRNDRMPFWIVFLMLMTGLASLVMNYAATDGKDVRRKIRVLFWGTVVGLLPGLLLFAVQNLTGYKEAAWLGTLFLVLSFLFPLSFAYAVVRHRVVEIPVLLKRSARYLLVQRGFTLMLSVASIGLTLIFALSITAAAGDGLPHSQPLSIALGAMFGTVILWGGTQIHRNISGRIDRRFFRMAYDARMILENLAQRTAAASDGRELASMLEDHLTKAFRPAFLAVYLKDANGAFLLSSESAAGAVRSLPAASPHLDALAQRGQPVDVSEEKERGMMVPPELVPLAPECIVPIGSRTGKLAGIILLGMRRSEEPYSGEDLRLLASVGAQASAALDNIRLAGEIAERFETDRRLAHELEIAQQVQNRLLPQKAPGSRTLDIAARCVQAQSVGGDYFDFLEPGSDRIGFVLGDVSGKGISAALLGSNVQAHMRSLCAVFPRDPVKLLTKANELLWKSTDARHFVTLFLGMYDEKARRLVYVNCGHNPPLALGRNGTLRRLMPTAPALGAFKQWKCRAEHLTLGPDDCLLIYSDGLVEARRGDEEFGEERLTAEFREQSGRPAGDIVESLLSEIDRFSGGVKFDDQTLMVLKGLGGIVKGNKRTTRRR